MSKSVKTLVTNVSQLKARLDWVVEMATRGLASGPVEITLGKPSKSAAAERKYHCLIKDISTLSSKHNLKVWKGLMVKWFCEEMEEAGTPLSSPGEKVLDPKSQEFFFIRPSTTDFRVGEASQFIEFLYAYGSRNGVQWSKYSTDIYNQFRESK